MDFQLKITDDEIHFNSPEINNIFINQTELKKKMVESLIIALYREAKLSIGQISNLLGVSIHDSMEWMTEKGIYKLGSLNPEIEEITTKNRRILEEKLKSKFNKI